MLSKKCALFILPSNRAQIIKEIEGLVYRGENIVYISCVLVSVPINFKVGRRFYQGVNNEN